MKHLKLHYPSAIDWMWNYCIYLGPFTSSLGINYDLGIFINSDRFYTSAAIVYGNKPGNYYSGDLNIFGFGVEDRDEAYHETRKRAKSLNLY